MKKSIIVIVLLLNWVSFIDAKEKKLDIHPKSIVYNDVIPQKIRIFIKKFYPKIKVKSSKIENGVSGKKYDIELTNGVEIEFDNNYRWTEIKDPNGLPSGIAPYKIQVYINENHDAIKIKKIDKEKRIVKVELMNDVDLEFNSYYHIIDKE